MVVEIVTAVLTGAVLVMFIEYQHIEKDVTDRFYSIMKPFYHKLTLFGSFVTFYKSIYRYKDKNDEYCQRMKKNIEIISDCADKAILSETEISIMTAKDIEQLCMHINDIWYVYDKGWFVRNNIEIDTHNFQTSLYYMKETLTAYNPKYLDMLEDKDLLPTIAGEFYTNEWLAVKDCTPDYEYWQEQCKFFHNFSFGAIIYLLLVLFAALCVPEYQDSVVMGFFAVISLGVLGFDIYFLRRLMTLSQKLLR